MQPLKAWPLEHRRRIIGIFTDIDDTLTTGGAITPDALQALHNLKAAGLHVIPITGRPVGWSEEFALSWPVDALVAENGAVALTAGHAANRHIVTDEFGGKNSTFPTPILDSLLLKSYQQTDIVRSSHYQKMQSVVQRILAEVPQAKASQDSAGRETDIAIDHSEFTHLSPQQVAHVVRIMQSEGMHATVSSIHINGWFGDHNKLQGARWIVRQLFDRNLDLEMDRWAYIGDSTNDQLMFEAFAHSVGVANIARFAGQLAHLPRYVTHAERGAGFSEFSEFLLSKIAF